MSLAFVLAAGLGGCAGDGNLVRDVAVASGITGGEPKPPPDFVSRSRRDGLDYQPVTQPKRERRAKDAAAVKSAEAEMDALRAGNEARGAAARRAAQ